MKTNRSITLVSLLSMGLSASLIFLAGELVLDYGAFGGIAFTASMFITLLLIYLHSLFIKDKTESRINNTRSIYLVLTFLAFTETMMTQTLVFVLILKSVASLSTVDMMACFIVLQLLLFAFQRFFQYSFRSLISAIAIGSIISLAILLPNYIYLQKGLETVYHNLLHYHPQILHLDQTGLLQFFIASTIILFVKMFTQLRIANVQIKNEMRKISLVVFVISTIVLSFSTMTIIAITERIRTSFQNEQLLILIKGHSSSFIYTIILIVLVMLVIVSMITSYSSIQTQTKIPLVFIIIANLLSLLFIYEVEEQAISMLDLFLFWGLFYVPFGFVFLYFRFIGVTNILMICAPIVCILLSMFSFQKSRMAELIIIEIGVMFILLLSLFLIHLLSRKRKKS